MFANYMSWVPRWQDRGKFPLSRDLLTVLVCGWVVALVRTFNITGDQAITNVVTLIATFVAAMALWLWFQFVSRFSLAAKRGLLGALVLALVLLAVLVKIERVSGTLVPEWSWRFWPREKRELPPPEAPAAGLLLAGGDYPGFLGAQRQAWVDWPGIRLARDWQARPPREVWREEEMGEGWSSFAVQNGYAVTLEQQGEQEVVSCYDAFTGALQWAHKYDAMHHTVLGFKGPRSTPTLHNGRVYAVGATGVLNCLSGASGQPLWTKNIPQLLGITQADDEAGVAWGRSGSPLVVDNLVVVPGGKKKSGQFVSLLAFEALTGELVWEGGDTQISYSSPTLVTLAGTRQILAVHESHLAGHDPLTGRLLWSQFWKGTSSADANTSQPLALGGTRVLVSKGYGQGAALFEVSRQQETWQVEPVWENRKVLLTKFTNVAVQGQYAYGLTDGDLQCVNLETGDSLWRVRGGPYDQGQVLRVNDVLLVQAEQGEVYLVEATPKEHKQLAKLEALSGQTWNNPAVFVQRQPAGGWGFYLLVRNAQQAACFELPLE